MENIRQLQTFLFYLLYLYPISVHITYAKFVSYTSKKERKVVLIPKLYVSIFGNYLCTSVNVGV